ncbi:SDR family NAD(P)-dependent oxidoreductase [Paenibacillus sp. LPE1-1-1.1]|uniref:SDR family NAD(P)-dependent oxidoreductase n=1 Tax=Paenibacillus sp. LPE1-1-1.1 TaxID=3135230 RepID=UPI003424C65A
MQDKQVALVTGANRGIGYELAQQLASMGFKVMLASRDSKKGAEAAQRLTESGLDVSFVVMDVTDPESIRQAALTVTENAHRLDVLINNAGVYLDGNSKLLTMDPAILERTMSTNFFGVYHVMRSFLPLMEKRGFGRIINISSEYGAMSAMSSPEAGAYKISKLAMNALTRLAAAEVGGDIKVYAVDPGWVSSDMGGPSAPRTPKRAAELILGLVMKGSEGPRGGFFRDGKPIDW